MWTLKHSGIEKAFADWGLSQPGLRRRSQDIDVLSVTAPSQAFDQDPLFAYGDEVEVWRDGTRYFVGRCTQIPRSGTAKSESVRYEFSGPWWWLENLVYQQEWGAVIDTSNPKNSIAGQYQSHVIVYQSRVGGWIGIRTQIEDVITYAAGTGAPIQISSDIPDTLPAKEEVRDVPCSEIIRRALRWMPDAVTWFDYGTTPPTLHISRRGSLPAASLDINAGDLISDIDVRPRYDLLYSVVALKFERIDTVNNASFRGTFTDKYPADQPERQLGALLATIDLVGVRETTISASITSEVVIWNQTDWWKARVGWLSQPGVSFQITSLAVDDGDFAPPTDADPQPVGDLPFELRSGQIAPWMPGAAARRVTLRAKASVMLKDATGTTYSQADNQDISTEITLTNLPTGTYTTVQSIEAGETPPVGLAQTVFEAVGTLHYEGTVTLDAEEVVTEPRLGQVLNLTGGRSEWSTMRGLVQQVDEDWERGSVTITFGPATHLGPADLLELLRVTRQRVMLTNPATQADPNAVQPGQVQLGEHTPLNGSSTNPGLPSIWSLGQGSGDSKQLIQIDLLGGIDWPGGSSKILPRQVSIPDGAGIGYTGYILTLVPGA